MTPGPPTSSDHIPIIAKITANPITIPIQPRKQVHKANWSEFREELSRHATTEIEDATSSEIDTYLADWTSKVQQASDNHIPTLTHRITPGVKPTDDILWLQNQYKITYDLIRLHGITQDRHKQLQDLRHAISHEYGIQSNNSWNKIIDEIDTETDPQRFWSSIKRFKGNNKQSIPYIRDHNNVKLHTEEEKEEHFRKHWVKIFQNEDSNDTFDQNNLNKVENSISTHTYQLIPFNRSDSNRLNPHFPPISQEEMKMVIKSFRQKAPGPSQITAHIIKNLPPNMITNLINIFNACLSLGYFPTSLKHAIMIFIPKGLSSQHQVQNYRPISLLDIHGKILDKILNYRLTHLLEHSNTNNPRQHGFRKHRGTHTALATFYETLSNNYQHDKTQDIVLRDVAKAFDKVWHNGLKYKIFKLRLHTCFTRILCSFLTDRSASIRLQHHVGPAFPLRSGVPQGACLSPTLYNLYTHDIPEPSPHTDYLAYADDITQIISQKYSKKSKIKHKRISKLTQQAITDINNFENKWKIKTNTNKFTVVGISRQKQEPIEIEDTILDYSPNGKVLGLTFGKHSIIQQVKIRKKVSDVQLTKLQRFRHLNEKNKLKLYKTLILPSLIYPTVPLNTLSNFQFKTLQKTQNKGLRFVTNTHFSEFSSNKTLHDRLKIDPINITIHRHAKNTWNKLKTHMPDTYNALLENYDPPRYKTRYTSSRTQAESDPPSPIY